MAFHQPRSVEAESALYDQNYAPGGSSWVPGLLALPPNETRRATLAIRATWDHISKRLQDNAKVEASVRSAVADVEGTQDAVVADMVLRHLDRCAAEQDLGIDALAHLLGILIGLERAVRLARAVVKLLEEGMEESWYEKQMRRKYARC